MHSEACFSGRFGHLCTMAPNKVCQNVLWHVLLYLHALVQTHSYIIHSRCPTLSSRHLENCLCRLSNISWLSFVLLISKSDENFVSVEKICKEQGSITLLPRAFPIPMHQMWSKANWGDSWYKPLWKALLEKLQHLSGKMQCYVVLLKPLFL
jgi:hypothetical protein